MMDYNKVAFVSIILQGASLRSARFALYSQHKKHGRVAAARKALKFKGPTFILSRSHSTEPELLCAVGHTTVNVVADGTEYIYPLRTVGRIKIID